MPTKNDCRAHRMQAQWTEVDHNADRLAVGAGLLARAAAAPETPSKGQVRRLSVFDSISGSYASRLNATLRTFWFITHINQKLTCMLEL